MRTLEPDASLVPPAMPATRKGLFEPASVVTDLSAGNLGIKEGDVTTLRVNTGNFLVNAMVNNRKKGDRLIVTFHGARRSKAGAANNAPLFLRHDWEEIYGCPILSISDPLGEGNWGIGMPKPSMYFGNFDHDMVPETNALIDQVCDEVGVSRDSVVMYGASSGGTAALLTGSRRDYKTGVIAVCSYLRQQKAREQVLKMIAEAMGGDLKRLNQTVKEKPERLSPLHAMEQAYQAGRDFRAVIVQNTLDVALMNNHFPALLQRFRIDMEEGKDPTGRILAMTYTSEEGHGQEPDNLVMPLIKTAFEHFDSPITPPANAGGGEGGEMSARSAKKKMKGSKHAVHDEE